MTGRRKAYRVYMVAALGEGGWYEFGTDYRTQRKARSVARRWRRAFAAYG